MTWDWPSNTCSCGHTLRIHSELESETCAGYYCTAGRGTIVPCSCHKFKSETYDKGGKKMTVKIVKKKSKKLVYSGKPKKAKKVVKKIVTRKAIVKKVSHAVAAETGKWNSPITTSSVVTVETVVAEATAGAQASTEDVQVAVPELETGITSRPPTSGYGSNS